MKLAQLGTWHLHAEHHLAASQHNPHTEVVVVWDKSDIAAAAFAEVHNIPYELDLDVVLARSDIAAVIVDTATTDHFEVISAALRAGKHVFSEKVLATTTDDARALAHLALDNNLLLEVSFPLLNAAPVRTISRLVAQGALGHITGSRIRWAHHGAVGEPWIPEHFFSLADTGGGALIDLGAHPIYMSMLFHGADPQSVFCSTSYVSGREVEDNAVMIMRYPNGALSVVEMSMVASYFGFSIEVIGDLASVALGPTNSRLMLRIGSTGEWREQELDDELPDGFDQWVDRILTGERDGALEHVAVEVTRAIEAGYVSAGTASAVRVGSVEV